MSVEQVIEGRRREISAAFRAAGAAGGEPADGRSFPVLRLFRAGLTARRGEGIDVRPHPHIGLATITYLFEGSQMHRDTLGSVQEVLPGDVNWMTAGRGIAHSERTGDVARAPATGCTASRPGSACPPPMRNAARISSIQGGRSADHRMARRAAAHDRRRGFGMTSPVELFGRRYMLMPDRGGSRLGIGAEYASRPVCR